MRIFQSDTLLSVASIMFILILNACSVPYKGPLTDHFDGSHFFNEEPDHSFTDMIKWIWEMETVTWPEWIEDPKHPPPVKQVRKGGLRVTYINHATILIQMDGLNILTDPIWSRRAGPFSWAGPKRIRAPGIQMKDLPEIHYILISHDHYDHLDLPTLKKLVEQHEPVILTGLGVRTLLSSRNIPGVVEMDWWQTYYANVPNVRFNFVPSRHNSGRVPSRHNLTLWGGFVIESPAGEVYYAGDTAYGDFLDGIAQRFNRIRIALFPIGSYEKRWFMKTQHMNPDDAVRAHKMLGAHQSIGFHFGTFKEHPEQTIDAHEKDLNEALIHHGVPLSRFWILQFGEGRNVPVLPNLS